MSVIAAWCVAQLAVTSLMVGVFLVVQLVVYPQFLQVPAAAFVAYHRQHVWRMSVVVIAPMLLELVLALGCVGLVPRAWPWAGLVLLLMGWGLTFAGAVPLHRRLERGRDDGLIRRLIAINAGRTVLWSGRWLLLLIVAICKFDA